MVSKIKLKKCPCGSTEKPMCGRFAFWYAAKCPDCYRLVEGSSAVDMASKWNADDTGRWSASSPNPQNIPRK